MSVSIIQVITCLRGTADGHSMHLDQERCSGQKPAHRKLARIPRYVRTCINNHTYNTIATRSQSPQTTTSTITTRRSFTLRSLGLALPSPTHHRHCPVCSSMDMLNANMDMLNANMRADTFGENKFRGLVSSHSWGSVL